MAKSNTTSASLMSTCVCLVGAEVTDRQTDRQTDKQTDYCNPSRRLRAPRVEYIYTSAPNWGERSEPLSYESTVSPPTLHLWVCMYVCMYVCISIFRPTIWRTFSTSGAHVCLFEGPKRFRRRPARPEEDVDALLEWSDANVRSRRRYFRLSATPL